MTAYMAKNDEMERHFLKVGEDAVLKIRAGLADEDLLDQCVFLVKEFGELPKKSQTYVRGFVQGVMRGIVRIEAAREMAKLDPIGHLETHITGQPPAWIKNLQPDAEWKRHPHGTGWVSSTAYVEATAQVAGRAVVYGNARVYDRARVYGAAQVSGDAEVFGVAHVHGKAVISGKAKVCDAAKILGEAVVTGTAQVAGTSVIRGDVRLVEGSYIDRIMTQQEAPLASPRTSSEVANRPVISLPRGSLVGSAPVRPRAAVSKHT